MLHIAEDLEPADHHVLSRDVALRLSDASLRTEQVIFAELAHQPPLPFKGARLKTIAKAAPMKIAACAL